MEGQHKTTARGYCSRTLAHELPPNRRRPRMSSPSYQLVYSSRSDLDTEVVLGRIDDDLATLR